MKLSFTKMQGCANDYIYLDCRASGVPADIAALAQRLSARHFSVGADGIICICAPVTPGADGRMRIFNADGSEAQMCGNGVRCVAEWLYTHGVEKPVLTIDTNSGVKRITRQGAQLWQVAMGAYSTLPADLPAIHMGEGPLVDQPLTVEGKVWKVTCISVGNPHCVTVVEDVDSLKLEAIGVPGIRAGMILPVKFKDIEVLAGSRLLLAEKVTHKWDGEFHTMDIEVKSFEQFGGAEIV